MSLSPLELRGRSSASALGVQLHPEKSQRVGLQLLRNFAERIVQTPESHA